MELSIFLARVFGLYLVIAGFLYFTRRHFIEKAISEFYDHNALILTTGVINLIIGLLIVVGHNVWTWSWVVVITILGYLTLIKGLVRLFAPDGGDKKIALKLSKKTPSIFVGIVCLIIGFFLVYEGFLGI